MMPARILFAVCLGAFQTTAALADKAPAATISPVMGYFDPRYPAYDDQRQHLGRDIFNYPNVDVVSPIDGTVTCNNTKFRCSDGKTPINSVFDAYLTIVDSKGIEHVLGHISSTFRVGDKVKAGRIVGKIKDWGSSSHVHWGINKSGVLSNISSTWGWGRAPYSATPREACLKGWVEKSSHSISTADCNKLSNARIYYRGDPRARQ